MAYRGKRFSAPKGGNNRALNLRDCYAPFPRQGEFHKSPAKYRLFGGAAGPGKTKGLLWEAIFQANEVPGCDTLLLRRTYPELESSLLAYFRRDVPRKFYKSYNESKHVVTWLNGSTTSPRASIRCSFKKLARHITPEIRQQRTFEFRV